MEIDKKINEQLLAAAISFDFAAAFDMLDHEFIFATMEMFEFPNQMISMLRMMTRGCNARIIDDSGELSRPFFIK